MPPSPLGSPRRRLAPRTTAIVLAAVVASAGAVAYALSHRGPKAIGGATRVDVQWRMPRTVTEERTFTLRLQGGTDGHASLRTQLRTGAKAAGCPGEPPESSSRRVLTDLPDPEQKLGRGIGDSQQFRVDDSGRARLCGWLLSTSAAGDATQLARFDRPIRVQPAPATLAVRHRRAVRAGARFTLRASGLTTHPGRRVLVLAVPSDAPDPAAPTATTPAGADPTATSPLATTPAPGQAAATTPGSTTPGSTAPQATTPQAERARQAVCRDLRAAKRSAKQPVRLEARLQTGDYLRRVKVRFPYLSVGTWQLCVQVIEADDPEPEAIEVRPIIVSESRECEQAKVAIGDRRDDLRLLRRRRAVLAKRVTTAHRAARAATNSRHADAARRREIANEARLKSYQVGTKAISQLIGRVTEDARQYCPDL